MNDNNNTNNNTTNNNDNNSNSNNSNNNNSNNNNSNNINNSNENKSKGAGEMKISSDWRKSFVPSVLRTTQEKRQSSAGLSNNRTKELENIFELLFEMCDYFSTQNENDHVEGEMSSFFLRTIVNTVLSIFNDHVASTFNITRVRAKLKFLFFLLLNIFYILYLYYVVFFYYFYLLSNYLLNYLNY